MKKPSKKSIEKLANILKKSEKDQCIIKEKSIHYNIQPGDSIFISKPGNRHNQYGVIEFISTDGVGLLFSEPAFKNGPVTEFFEWHELEL